MLVLRRLVLSFIHWDRTILPVLRFDYWSLCIFELFPVFGLCPILGDFPDRPFVGLFHLDSLCHFLNQYKITSEYLNVLLGRDIRIVILIFVIGRSIVVVFILFFFLMQSLWNIDAELLIQLLNFCNFLLETDYNLLPFLLKTFLTRFRLRMMMVW